MTKISIFRRMTLVAAGALLLPGCDRLMSSQEHSAGPAQTTASSAASTASPLPAVQEHQSPEDKVTRIGAEETRKLVEDGKAVIIDVRGTDSYNLSHVKGALDIPLNNLEMGNFKGLPKDKRIIAYCT